MNNANEQVSYYVSYDWMCRKFFKTPGNGRAHYVSSHELEYLSDWIELEEFLKDRIAADIRNIEPDVQASDIGVCVSFVQKTKGDSRPSSTSD